MIEIEEQFNLEPRQLGRLYREGELILDIGKRSVDYAGKELDKAAMALGRAMRKPNVPRREIQDLRDKINTWAYICQVLEREAANEQE